MVRLDYFIFGYRKITLANTEQGKLLSRLISLGASAMLSDDRNILINEPSYLKCERYILRFSGVSVSETLGFRGYLQRLKHKSAIVSAVLFSLVLVFLLSETVWDVRIEGNELYSDSSIRDALADCGFRIGSLWLTTDKSEVENHLSRVYPGVSWVNINRRGTVAYVSVCEKEIHPDTPKDTFAYSNIVATHDCVVEEITVYSGTALVKVGDTVRAGDVLISGSVTTDRGTVLCRAEGNVIGRLSSTVEAPVMREYEKSVLAKEKISELRLNIFNFSIEIFKNYGNPPVECDIIEEKSTFSLLGGCRLPIELYTRLSREYTVSPETYTDEQIVGVASARLTSLIASELLSADLLSITTSGCFTEQGYTMRADLVYLTEVGKALPYEVEE